MKSKGIDSWKKAFIRRLIFRTNRIVLYLFLCLGVASGTTVYGSNPTLNDTLVNARQSVETFWAQFKSVTCIERVTQEKLGKRGKTEYKQQSTFDYLVLLNVENNGISVEESRLRQGKKRKPKSIPLLVTNGVPTLLLVFHPYYQEDFNYRLQGDEPGEGRGLVKIEFKHVPGMKSTTALRLRGKDYPLEIEGTAWIESETGAIHRIVAVLAAPVTDLNLKSLKMEVWYNPHRFSSNGSTYWLPSTATVDIETERQHWRNVHRYSEYKRFTVDAVDEISR